MTSHYMLLSSLCLQKTPTKQPITVTLPNSNRITSTHDAELPFPNLPLRALKAHIFPTLQGQALLSIGTGTFYDAGCTTTFTATAVKIERKLVLEGAHVRPGLWAINLPRQETNTHKVPLAYSGQITTVAIEFLHVACFSPTTATWMQAINKGFF
jgi:hypothetical protein